MRWLLALFASHVDCRADRTIRGSATRRSEEDLKARAAVDSIMTVLGQSAKNSHGAKRVRFASVKRTSERPSDLR
jgi:hypothetical protein